MATERPLGARACTKTQNTETKSSKTTQKLEQNYQNSLNDTTMIEFWADCDLHIVNREYRVYRKPDGTLQISDDRQNGHYHLNPLHVWMQHYNFILSMLNIPRDLRPKLTAVHWDWFTSEFEMIL